VVTLPLYDDQFTKVGTRLDELAGDPVTCTKLGQSGVVTTAVRSDIADNDEVIGRRFSGILESLVILEPGDEITDADDTWVVTAAGKTLGGRNTFDCLINQGRG